MNRIRRAVLAAASAALIASLLGTVPAAADPPPEPVPGYAQMGPPPDGANDWSCKPSPAHPRPVVLVHGTNSNMVRAFGDLSPVLKEQGYCVFALNYGGLPVALDPDQMLWGMADINQSAKELATFVDAVLAHTGTSQADLIGHSQGGTVSRMYMKYEGGVNRADPSRNKVASLIGLGATNHGTTFSGLQVLYLHAASLAFTNNFPAQKQLSMVFFGVAGAQQLVNSALIKRLNEGGETQQGVQYTAIATQQDEIVTPPHSAFLTPAPNVRNIWVQDGCPQAVVTHGGLLTQARPIALTLAALDPAYGSAHPAPCPG